MKDEHVARQTALALLIVVAPFLLLGALLTVSLFGAFFGLPLLLVTVPPALMPGGHERRARRLSATR